MSAERAENRRTGALDGMALDQGVKALRELLDDGP